MTETRDHILSCACDLYLEDGLHGFSMRKLARTVGVTAPALYRHYESKEHLLLDVVGEAYKLFSQYLHRALGGADAVERFRTAGDEYLTFALEHPHYYEILYSYSRHPELDEPPEEIRTLAVGIHQFWLDRVRECMEAGFLREDDPESVARTFWALCHGYVSIYQKNMLDITEEEFRTVVGASVKRLLTGVGAREPEESPPPEPGKDVGGGGAPLFD